MPCLHAVQGCDVVTRFTCWYYTTSPALASGGSSPALGVGGSGVTFLTSPWPIANPGLMANIITTKTGALLTVVQFFGSLFASPSLNTIGGIFPKIIKGERSCRAPPSRGLLGK